MTLIAVILWPLFLAALATVPALRGRAGLLAPLGVLPALWLWLAGPVDASLQLPGVLTGVTLALDAPGRVFLALTALAWIAASIGLWRGMVADNRWRFVLFWLLTLAGNLTWVLAGDAVSFYLGFTLMSLAAWGLVVHSGQPPALRAGRVYLVMALAGEMAILAGLMMRVAAAGSADFQTLATHPVDLVTVLLLFLGFGIKVGVPLLHMWLPLAHPAAPVPASAVLSGVMLKAGIAGWLRFLPAAEAMPEWGVVLIVVGIFAMFFGVMVGLAQSRPKTILAYSSISQMGWLTAGVGLWLAAEGPSEALLAAVLLFALHHGLAKSALFLSLGLVPGGRLTPGLRLLAWLPALALAALPMTSGMVAKAALKGQFMVGAPVLDVLLILAGMGTFWLMLHFFAQLPRPKSAARFRVDPWLLGSWILLVLVGQGLFWWWPQPELARAQVEGGKLLSSLWPAALALLVYLWLDRAGRLPRQVLPAWPEGDVLAGFERIWQRAVRGIRLLGAGFDREQQQGWAGICRHVQALSGLLVRLLAQERSMRLWQHFILIWAALVLVVALLLVPG